MSEEPIDLSEELFRFLNVEDPGRAVAKALEMFAAYQDQGRETEALETARKAVMLLDTHVSKLSSGREFKKASQQMIAAAKIFQDVLKSEPDAHQAYRKAAELLEKAAEEHRIWEDIDGAAAAIAVSCLVGFLGDNFDVEGKIGAFEGKIDLTRATPTVTTILKIPRGFATAIQHTNPDWFVWARDSVYSVLLLSPVAKPYEEQIHYAMTYVEKKMSAQIKFPNLAPHLEMPRDLVFGEEFQVSIGLMNEGEGVAKNVSFSIELPGELQLRAGELTSTMETINPGQDIEQTLILIAPSGEGRLEIETQLKMTISYEDILGSKRTLPFGPFPILLRAYRKADEVRENINKTTTALESDFEEIKEVELTTAAKQVIDTLESLARTFLEKSNAEVDAEEFERAETYIEAANLLHNQLTEDFRNAIKPKVLLENEIKQVILKTSEAIEPLTIQVRELLTKLAEISQKLETVLRKPEEEIERVEPPPATTFRTELNEEEEHPERDEEDQPPERFEENQPPERDEEDRPPYFPGPDIE
ncbi:MAG: hypothetical protein ACE5R6_15755 [Candidatus Heimdallarchaeota archaeon]